MKRLGLVLCLLLAACDKPTEENCRKALLNMEALLGTDNMGASGALEGEVRRCRGGSSKDAVACAMKATTLEELEKCDFTKVRVKARPGSGAGGSGSAPGSGAGSGSGSGSG
jgi:hypothetical protein